MNVWLQRRPLLFAHQGGALEAPANTLYAFATAVAQGADALELDVHATLDGHLVVLHDDTVDHVTEGTGAVAELTLVQVQRLDAAHWFVAGAGSPHDRAAEEYTLRGVAAGDVAPPDGFASEHFRIPTLDAVLEMFPDTLVNIDIKATAPSVRAYEEELAGVLAAHGRGSDTMVASFHEAALAAFTATGAPVSTSATPGEVAAFWAAVHEGRPYPRLGHRQALQIPLTFADLTVATPALVAAAHERDLAVHVWTIDDADTVTQLLGAGVDGIVSDRPRALAGVVHRGSYGHGTLSSSSHRAMPKGPKGRPGTPAD